MWKAIQKRFDSPDSYVSLALGLAVVLVIGMIAFNYLKGQPGILPMSPEQKAEQEKQEAATLPAQHKVGEGETLWSIAEKYYKSGYNWVDIQKENKIVNPDRVEAGQTLTIPAATPIPAPSGQVSAASTEKKTYTVKKGDSLWTIGVSQYGSGYKWVEIAKANSLTNPDLIYSGNVLTLP